MSVNREIGDTNPEPLSQFILHQQHITAPHARGHLTLILNAICIASKFVENSVRKAGLAGVLGLAGASNVQGEQQKKLDIIANEVFVNVLKKSGQCRLLVSEEEEEPIYVEEKYRGDYCVVFDPLDGSSNIECGVSIGSIFGIYHATDKTEPLVADVLQAGNKLVAAGYCMYGSSCTMVLSVGNGVHCFTLDPNLGEFVLTQKNIIVPKQGKIYSINEGNAATWNEPTKRFVEECKFPKSGKPKSLRYVGSMVADVHRTLLYGGIFMYPADQKSPKGKLRMLYECFPMAYLMEQAGAKATTGTQRMLDVLPEGIHDRAPIFLGSQEDIDRIEQLYKEAGL